VTRRAAARAVIELVTGADELFRGDVRAQGQRARHFGLHLGKSCSRSACRARATEHHAEDGRLLAHMRRLHRRRHERRLLGKSSEPEDEADEREEDQHAGLIMIAA